MAGGEDANLCECVCKPKYESRWVWRHLRQRQNYFLCVVVVIVVAADAVVVGLICSYS